MIYPISGGVRTTMASKTFTLLNAEKNLAVSEFAITSADTPDVHTGCSVRQLAFHGGRREGVTGIELDNGALRVVVLPTRGMGLWKAWHGPRELGWNSPVNGPVHPSLVNLNDPAGLGWLDGFDELLCRCGLQSNGAPDVDAETGKVLYPLHGKIANLPAHSVEVLADNEAGSIAVRGVVDEARFHFQKLRLTSTTRLIAGQPTIEIVDEITNLSASNATAQLLYHTNFGPPWMEPGGKFLAPVKRVAPRDAEAASDGTNWNAYPAPQVGAKEHVHFMELVADPTGQTQVLLRNAAGNLGVGMTFNKVMLPYFTLWKNHAALADGYVTGLEPGTNFPNPRSFEAKQGRVLSLEPSATLRFELSITVYPDAAAVERATKQIAELAGSVKAEVATSPMVGWSE